MELGFVWLGGGQKNKESARRFIEAGEGVWCRQPRELQCCHGQVFRGLSRGTAPCLCRRGCLRDLGPFSPQASGC